MYSLLLPTLLVFVSKMTPSRLSDKKCCTFSPLIHDISSSFPFHFPQPSRPHCPMISSRPILIMSSLFYIALYTLIALVVAGPVPPVDSPSHSAQLASAPTNATSVLDNGLIANVQSRPTGVETDNLRPTSLRRKIYNQQIPQCARTSTRAKSFLVIFMGHSGSSAIVSELKSHPQVLIENKEPVDHGEYASNTTLALEYTADFFRRAISLGKTPGFKMRPSHIKNNPAAWVQLTREFDTRIIWQYRRNLLKQAIGEYSYRYLSDDSILEGLRSEEEVKHRCETGAGCSFEIEDMNYFYDVLSTTFRSDFSIAQATHLLADGRDCIHELRYEDYLYHRKGALKDLFQFLGLDDVETEPNRYKATGDNLCHVIKNWDELCSNFYGCSIWRHLFEDERNGCSCKFARSPRDFCHVRLYRQ